MKDSDHGYVFRSRFASRHKVAFCGSYISGWLSLAEQRHSKLAYQTVYQHRMVSLQHSRKSYSRRSLPSEAVHALATLR